MESIANDLKQKKQNPIEPKYNKELNKILLTDDSEKILYEIAGTKYLDTVYAYRDDLKKQSLQGLVLDIDETLSDTNMWLHEEIVKFFGSAKISKEYNLCHNPSDNLDIEKRVQEKLKDDRFWLQLPPIEGALDVYNNIHNTLIPVVGYLTARPDNLGQGTKEWLENHGFPQAHVICKPAHLAHEKRMVWKIHTLQLLYPHVQGIVDDDPKLAEDLLPHYEGKIFLYHPDPVHGEKEQIYSSPTHEHIIANIKNYFHARNFS